jgi:hypothetical protein
MLRMRSTFSREIFRISLDMELGLYTYTRRDNLYFAFVHRATATSKTSEGSSLIIYFCSFSCINIWYYNIAFVNSERWLAKSRVDIIQCQHGNVGKFLSLCFFVLYYKTNINHFFRIDMWLYQHSKLCKNTPPFGRRVSTQFLVVPISTRVDITVYQHGKCFIFVNY